MAKHAVSRPLRAFVVVITGWTALRVAVLWQATAVIAAPLVDLRAEAARTPQAHAPAFAAGVTAIPQIHEPNPTTSFVHRALATHSPTQTGAQVAPVHLQPPSPRSQPTPGGSAIDNRIEPSPTPWLASVTTASRFSGSVWAMFRQDSAGSALGTGGTLGGSQAGVRMFYEPGPRGLALTGRLSAPLAMRTGREASVGVGIRGRQVGLLLERRIALDHGARNAMSLTAYGGISDVVLPYGLRMDGYVQFGLVGARSRDGFADGALRVVRPLAQAGPIKLSAGGAVSGGAQPGVERVDVGPELVGDLAIAGTTVRLTAGWRERVAGNAAPGSGPSLTLGFGF